MEWRSSLYNYGVGHEHERRAVGLALAAPEIAIAKVEICSDHIETIFARRARVREKVNGSLCLP
jgi:hypothetical protein